MDKFKIVADSSADLVSLPDVPFSFAPLKIITAEAEYVDDENLDVENMVESLLQYKGKSTTSCPNPDEWLKVFGEAENIFCVPISGNISGSYNAAKVAKDIYESEYPDRRVYVVNTLSAGPEMKLIIEKICEMIKGGAEFEEICRGVEEYTKKTGLFFLLQSVKNFANNGRINPLIAKGVGLLGIRILGKASDNGQLQLLDKCRGGEKALAAIIRQLKSHGLKSGKVRITHCLNESAAQKLYDMIHAEFRKAEIQIYKCRGLCSFYAEKGGLLVGFEKC
ncbi:MAG: DegV family protein [Clostridia bacterium]|nr:DegV family protein [Clostridia bacterium]